MQITRLRLAGFKSFVEPTELRIEPGLTGIVGPNGCGKSNLVEALRWAMGESSARRMRASELEDVIFAGTASRPARNFAEVAIALDNQDGLAPAPYRDQPVVEIVRRLPRGGYSGYRVNGRAARARDVQQMMADAATGARSTAIVAQGQIGAFVAAKPTERRGLLEEAAGVAGLYTRRQDAETRLRAAETNLDRLEDVLATLLSQRQGLEKQARQARRFRKLAEHIREAELLLFALRWHHESSRRDGAQDALNAALVHAEEMLREAAHATKLQADAAAAMPGLRKQEAAAMAAWQRIAVERDTLESERARVAENQRETQRRVESLSEDLKREERLAEEAAAAIAALEIEAAALEAAWQADEADTSALDAGLQQAEETLKLHEARKTAIASDLAAVVAKRASAEREAVEADRQIAKIKQQLEQATSDYNQAAGAQPPAEEVERAEAAATRLRRERNQAQELLQSARNAENDAQAAAEKSEARRRDADRARLALATEAQTLAKLLSMPGTETPLLEHLHADPGFEAALIAALGEDVAASLDCNKPLHWRDGVPVGKPDQPPDCDPIAPRVKAPAALDAKLAHVWVAPDPLTAAALAKDLRPGQRLVTKDGGMWRWDGYTALAGAPTVAAQRLEQRNRLTSLNREVADADETLRTLTDAARNAAKTRDEAGKRRQQLREGLRESESALVKAEQHLSQLNQRLQLAGAKVEALSQAVERLRVDEAAWQARRLEADALLANLAEPAELESLLRQATDASGEAQRHWLAARDKADRHRQAQAANRKRAADISAEIESWRSRAEPAHSENLRRRLTDELEKLKGLEERPAEIDSALDGLQTALIDAEAARRVASDTLVQAEADLAELDQTLKSAEAAVANANAGKIRGEADLEQARQACANLEARLSDRLGVAPSELPEEPPAADEADLEQRLGRLEREQSALGDVNLRADTEIDELSERLSSLTAERDDLIAAIAKLRRGIGDLNRNARQRLMDAFHSVNGHFETLFTRMFGGGEAKLKLVGSDDPLDAGLEVLACPPGKKPQPLTALSGGERALTALSLLFAAFLTNPAPICVLDEVDAPLDDANVDRFCRLIEEIADQAGTRFLCITHHRLTMARMDRLYGVTMQERGVSHLVSVDLRRADIMRRPASPVRAAE